MSEWQGYSLGAWHPGTWSCTCLWLNQPDFTGDPVPPQHGSGTRDLPKVLALEAQMPCPTQDAATCQSVSCNQQGPRQAGLYSAPSSLVLSGNITVSGAFRKEGISSTVYGPRSHPHNGDYVLVISLFPPASASF